MTDTNIIKEKLATLKLREAELKERLSDNQLSQNSLLIELFVIETGLSIGDKVEFKDGKTTKTGVIERIKVQYSKVDPVVRLHKKNGELGLLTKDYWYSSLPSKINSNSPSNNE